MCNQLPVERCAACVYSPGTHDGSCPFDCTAMEAGYLASKYDSVDFIVGRVYLSSEPFVPANPLEGMPINPTVVFVNGVAFQPERKGWICPKCDNAVSPDEKTCPYCKPKPKKESDDNKPTRITE